MKRVEIREGRHYKSKTGHIRKVLRIWKSHPGLTNPDRVAFRVIRGWTNCNSTDAGLVTFARWARHETNEEGT